MGRFPFQEFALLEGCTKNAYSPTRLFLRVGNKASVTRPVSIASKFHSDRRLPFVRMTGSLRTMA